MTNALAISSLFTLIAALVIQRALIFAGHRWKLLDIPSSRRRHVKPVPIVGGLGVFASWTVGLTFYTFLNPDWIFDSLPSVLSIGTGVVTLIVLGLYDDLKGLGPYSKLLTQFLVAGLVLVYEPHIHDIMVHWSEQIGPQFGFAIWPLGALWIVGITNAINLIDGLDGLAGGMSLLVGFSIFLLSLYKGPSAFVWIGLAMLIPSLLGFLRYNWHPAKMFLGDNGSLPIGFLLACFSLSCRPVTSSWVMIASVILMLGYPILDMGLAVLRRGKSKMPLFKADRTHLHYRLMRFGLTVRQTASLLILIGLHLQIAALSFNFLDPMFAFFGIGLVVISVFTFLFLVGSIEKWQEKMVRDHLQPADSAGVQTNVVKLVTVLRIDLSPLVNTRTANEADRAQRLMTSLEFLLASASRQFERVFRDGTKLLVVFAEPVTEPAELEMIRDRFGTKIREFLQLYNVDCALAELPTEFKTEAVLTEPTRLSVVGTERAA